MHGKRILSGDRVLLTVDESTGSLAAARALRAAGYEPWIALSQKGTYVERSRAVAGRIHVPPPTRDPLAYVEAVAAAASSLRAMAVLPATEATLRALTGEEQRFDEGIALGTTTKEALDRATDKSLLAQLAVEGGMASPETRMAQDGELELDGLAFPVLIKPRRSVTAGGGLEKTEVRRLERREDLLEALERGRDREWLVQPHIEGTLASASGVAWRGKTVCTSHQISHRIWPVSRGITAYGEIVPPDPVVDLAVRHIVDRIGWSGVFQLQFVRARDGAYAIDFNPRVYGSTALAVAAGLNLPAVWADLVLGRDPRVGVARPGTRYRAEEDDFRALATMAARGELRRALGGLRPRRRTTHAVFSVQDPGPALVTLAKLAGRGR